MAVKTPILERNYKPKLCRLCSKEFKPIAPKRIFCSEECAKLDDKRRMHDYLMKYRAEHKEILAKNKREKWKEAYYGEKREYLKSKHRGFSIKYYAKVRDTPEFKLREKAKRTRLRVKWLKENPLYFSTQNKRWRNSEKGKETLKNYNESEKGKLKNRKSWMKRDAIKRGMIHLFTIQDWKQLVDSSEGICAGCGKFVGKENLSLDHILPIISMPKGYTYTINAIQLLCKSCNSRKQALATGLCANEHLRELAILGG